MIGSGEVGVRNMYGDVIVEEKEVGMKKWGYRECLGGEGG